MNKRERVLAAIHRQPVDHTPACFWWHFPAEIARTEKFVNAQLDFYRKMDLDFLKISADGYMGWPAPVLENLTSAKQLYDIQPIGKDHPFIREQVERAKKIAEEINGECLVYYTMFCPLSYLRLQVGWDKMMACMKEDPEAVKHACEVIGEDVKCLVEGFIKEAKLDGIFYSVQNAEVNRFTYEEYREYVTPSDKQVLDYANALSDLNILHYCGWDADAAGTVNRMEDWADYRAAVANWAAYVDRISVSKAKEVFPDRCLFGGFDNRPQGVLYSGTEEEIKAETRRLIAEGGNGFILGPDCSLPGDIDPDHIKWVLEVCRE